ncbi:hypothetical protein C8J56DRAFT_920006 [Mycena floridula]|nr:hypothetical protein C8J56DRAFT_920006 [Mycena floridula]
MPIPDASPTRAAVDPLRLYSQSLSKYTLRIWTESRREAEERARAVESERLAKKARRV